jgi:DNA-binding GntR family transcriptional regulator
VDDAYSALKNPIRQGVLASGYQGSEQEIAGKLNMSRTPVHGDLSSAVRRIGQSTL